jgi:DNA invertase Pin-like site-specific DNA recombinase
VFDQTKTFISWNYYRHSAEDKQENSVPIQRERAQGFAHDYNIQITLEIADEGKSGLSADRPGFERLFKEYVLNPDVPKADYILVNDVSRWGRFQDPDEAAYWTMLCKQQGIQVIYIDKGFPDKNNLLSSGLQTQIERYMAADYSRQLSAKVFYGSAKVAEQGYSPGGPATFGLTRVLLDESKQFVRDLKPGEHKVIANQRVTFKPSDDWRSEAVKRMFDELTNNWRHPQKIAQLLNSEGILTATGKQWDTSKVVNVLSNERYAGTMVYNKTRKRLKSKSRPNPVAEWVRCENAFEGIVPKGQFELAQECLYWLMPSRHRYGIYRINAARREFRKYLQRQLDELDNDDKFRVLREFPVSFGLTFYQQEQAKQCFLLEQKHRSHDEVLCVGLDMFAKDKVDRVYKMPAKLFGVGDYLIVPDNDISLKQYQIDTTKANATIREICNTLVAA